MNKDFVLIKDNVFTKKECDSMIYQYGQKLQSAEKDGMNYNFCDLNYFEYMKRLNLITKEYENTFSEISKTVSIWQLESLRFKHFKPGKGFSEWHSEHCHTFPYRVLSLQIYLSEHNCGTEFYNKNIIKSEIGRVALFPAYFTHTHRGQVCPENKDRYIITGYISFIEKGKYE
jgi:hypothetical protein